MQLADLVKISTKDTLNKLKCKGTNKACFDVLGIDIMVTKGGNIKLLEFNAGVGYNLTGYRDESYEKCWRAELMSAVYRATLDKIIKPKSLPKRSRKSCPKKDFIQI